MRGPGTALVSTYIEKNLLNIEEINPLVLHPDQFASKVRDEVERRGTRMVMIDSINGYRQTMSSEDFLVGHMHQLASYLNRMGVSTILTNELATLTGRSEVTRFGLSHLVDTILLMKYYEFKGSLQTAIGVMKRRLGDHDRALRTLDITPGGIRVGDSLPQFRGILQGEAVRDEENDRATALHPERDLSSLTDSRKRPLVLVHCGWPRDRDLVGRLLNALGADGCPLESVSNVRRLVEEDRLDLVLADSSGGHRPLSELLEGPRRDARRGKLPLILLADTSDVDLLSRLAARRFNVTLLTKPVEPAQLAASIRAGLLFAAGQRENRRLIAELAMAHADSERRRIEAEAARQRYHDLVQGLDAIVWEAEAETGRFTFVSRRAEEMLGYPVESWLGEDGPWTELVHPEDRRYVTRTRRCALRDQNDFGLEYRVLSADGRILWLREETRVVRDEHGRCIGLRGLLWNITRRKKVERRLYTAKKSLAEQLSDMSYLHQLSTDLSTLSGQEPMLQTILGAVLSVYGAESGLLRLLDPNHENLTVGASLDLPPAFLEHIDRIPVGSTPCGQAIARGETVVIEDTEDPTVDADSREAASTLGYRAACSTPLVIRGGESMGVVTALFHEPHRPTERQIRLVELYARQAATFVEAARLHSELREADRHKNEFLAMLAHELRNPIAAISGAARVAQGAEDREAMDWGLDVIDRQSRHLARLVDDLLDVSRITRGKVELRKERIDAAIVLRQAAEAVRPVVEQKEHRLDINISNEALWTDADPLRLQQMVVNLLANAARYTPKGGLIQLGAERRGDEILLRVKDNGVGIPPEKLSRIFDLFVQGDRSPDRADGGLGIGLTLVKALAELHGGNVSVSSEGRGRGSEFVVNLPAATEPSQPTMAPANGTASPESQKTSCILIVDDSVDMARGLARFLSRAGHEVWTAHDAPTALKLAREKHPEMILLDIGLPGMDGYELASRIRREPWGREAILVAISGYGQAEDRRRSEEAGIDYHLVKPVDLDALTALIGREAGPAAHSADFCLSDQDSG